DCDSLFKISLNASFKLILNYSIALKSSKCVGFIAIYHRGIILKFSKCVGFILAYHRGIVSIIFSQKSWNIHWESCKKHVQMKTEPFLMAAFIWT
ncbi:MAG: hypothetical protein RR177_03930, partial [Oscillospiraceae bacterium]